MPFTTKCIFFIFGWTNLIFFPIIFFKESFHSVHQVEIRSLSHSLFVTDLFGLQAWWLYLHATDLSLCIWSCEHQRGVKIKLIFAATKRTVNNSSPVIYLVVIIYCKNWQEAGLSKYLFPSQRFKGYILALERQTLTFKRPKRLWGCHLWPPNGIHSLLVLCVKHFCWHPAMWCWWVNLAAECVL